MTDKREEELNAAVEKAQAIALGAALSFEHQVEELQSKLESKGEGND